MYAGLAPGRPNEGISTPSSQRRARWGPRRLGLRPITRAAIGQFRTSCPSRACFYQLENTIYSHGDSMETLYYSQMNSLIGPLNLAVSAKGLLSLEFDRNNFPPKKTKYGWEQSFKTIKPFSRELEEYFAGERRDFFFPFDRRATVFRVRCGRALLPTPSGEPRSYADIARAVRKP